jgi:hypothetical protein
MRTSDRATGPVTHTVARRQRDVHKDNRSCTMYSGLDGGGGSSRRGPGLCIRDLHQKILCLSGSAPGQKDIAMQDRVSLWESTRVHRMGKRLCKESHLPHREGFTALLLRHSCRGRRLHSPHLNNSPPSSRHNHQPSSIMLLWSAATPHFPFIGYIPRQRCRWIQHRSARP